MIGRFKEFTKNISVAYKYIIKLKSAAIKEFGLKGSHVMCLFYIGEAENGLTATKLCKLCGEDKANVSRTLKSLEDDFLIVKERKGQSHTRFMLTEDGLKLGKYLCDRVSSAVDSCALGIDENDIEAMYRALEQVDSNLSRLLENTEA